MALQVSKSAIMSKTLQFLTAGGLTLAAAIWQEIARPNTNWVEVATMVAGLLVGLVGGTYGRVVAQGPVTGLLANPAPPAR